MDDVNIENLDVRQARTSRRSKETQIDMHLVVDGRGNLSGEIPIPFFEHMLDHLTRYSLFDLELFLQGDLGIDCHHSVEDTAIVLGDLLREALGDKAGIYRYGSMTLPMDETLVTVAVDFSGRAYYRRSGFENIPETKFGIYDSELSHEFFHKLALHTQANIHVLLHYGENRHHIHEAVFKAAGMALRQAATFDLRRGKQIPSTKGML